MTVVFARQPVEAQAFAQVGLEPTLDLAGRLGHGDRTRTRRPWRRPDGPAHRDRDGVHGFG
ncbi:MAG: hypothetical protein NTX54_00350, partial [Chloroflexi bacterium]|nr:hypothetical protein [Chloroflexota bacterium]